MYSLSQLRRAIYHPKVFFREANRLYHRLLYFRSFNTTGIDVFSEDWDMLVILDGCRLDMFDQQVDIEGRLESRESRGSTTVEFLRGNVADRELLDTVYVTANPQFYRHREDLNGTFHATVDIWREEGWDQTYGTVLPETVTEYAIDAAEKYPNKRLLVHYVQPHYPFLTKETTFDKGYIETDNSGEGDFWSRLFTGELEIDYEELHRLYQDNLDRALPSVERLLDEVAGKAVLTADHGNMIGEPAWPVPIREWGHPDGLYIKKLVIVPWLVVDSDKRREHIAETPQDKLETVDRDIVNDRLESLGYVE